MKRYLKLSLTYFLIVAMIFSSSAGFITVASFADDIESSEVVLNVSQEKDVDVVLTVGEASLDVSNFSTELKSKLVAKGIDDNKINITSVESKDVSTEGVSGWKIYDHTNDASLDDKANGMYYFNETNGNYNIPKHIVTSGNQIDMYGNGSRPFRDFMYKPDSMATKKTFDFKVTEGSFYDALEGAGFIFNTDISGVYPDQLMSGYIMLIRYTNSSNPVFAEILRFENIDVEKFHDDSGGFGSKIQSDKKTGTFSATYNGFEHIAYSSLDDASFGFERNITLEVTPTSVNMIYNGSKLDWNNSTGTSIGENVALSKSYASYGFGPIIAYRTHGCSRKTHFTFKDITMSTDIVKRFSELIREPKWRESADRFVVNLDDAIVPGLTTTDVEFPEVITRLENEDIHYIGWGTDVNKAQAVGADGNGGFVSTNDSRGTFVNKDDVDQSYDGDIEKIASYIYSQYLSSIKEDVDVLELGSKFTLNVTPSTAKTSTNDSDWPNGKWRIDHDPSIYENNSGPVIYDNKYLIDLNLEFEKIGKYDIYYKDVLIKSIKVSRRPVSSFNADVDNSLNVTFTNNSYDLDKLSAIDKGIKESEWRYKKSDSASWTSGQPATLDTNSNYIIELSVTDYDDIKSSSKSKFKTTVDGSTVKPIAEFTMYPTTIVYHNGSTLNINESSYDPKGSAITEYAWEVSDGSTVTYTNTSATSIPQTDFSGYDAGEYKVSLTVKRADGSQSEEFSRTLTIIKDTTAPIGTGIAINDGKAYVTVTGAAISMNMEGANEVRLSENSDLSDSTWIFYSPKKIFELSDGDGSKTVYAQFRDEAGNVSSIYSDDIILDSVKPIVNGVTNDSLYINDVIPTFSEGVAKLNSEDFISGTVITENRAYSLSVVDAAGNETVVNFVINNPNRITYIYYQGSDRSDNITKDINLLTKDIDGNPISWKFSTSDIKVVTGPAFTVVTGAGSVVVSGSSVSVEYIPEHVSAGDINFPKYEDLIIDATSTLYGANGKVESKVTLIAKGYAVGKEATDYVADELEIGYSTGDSKDGIVNNVVLATNGKLNTTITWQSNDVSTINNSGIVNRPSYTDGDKIVEMTATVSNNGVDTVKKFTIKVLKLPITSSEMLSEASNDLEILYASGNSINYTTQNLTLPLTSKYDSGVVWSSSDDTYLNSNGIVNRPSLEEGDKIITLTAEITLDGVTVTKYYDVTVKAYTENDYALMAKDELEVNYFSTDTKDKVTKDLILPNEGKYDSKITWESSVGDIIKPDGTVNRPSYTEGNKKVTLTATIKVGDSTVQKTYDVEVIKMDPTDLEMVNLAKSNLEVEYQLGDDKDSVVKNITLDLLSDLGAKITWMSDNPSVIKSDGSILRPSFTDGTSNVKLTATITSGEITQTKEFDLRVIKLPISTQEEINEIKSKLTIDFADGNTKENITENIKELPTNNDFGATITWKSDTPKFIDANGNVTRPEAGKNEVIVILTAVIVKGDVTEEVEFMLKVRPQKEAKIEVNNKEDIIDSKMDDVIDGAKDQKENKITIIVDENISTEKSLEVSISKEKIKKIKEEKLNIKIEATNVSIEVPLTNRIIEELEASGSNSRLELVCEKIDITKEENKHLIKELGKTNSIDIYKNNIYDFKMKVIREDMSGNIIDENEIKDYKTEDEIELQIYIGKDAVDDNIYMAFYFNPKTSVWEFVRSQRDAESGQLDIKTNHLSIYSVMYVSSSNAKAFLIDSVINKKAPKPTLNEILNVIETPEMDLELDKYNKLSENTKGGIANNISVKIPNSGYSYDDFRDEFYKQVNKYSVEPSNSKYSEKKKSYDISNEVLEVKPKDESQANEEKMQEKVKFIDLDSHWSKNYAEKLADMGIIDAYENNEFKPDVEITRAEVVKILVKIADYDLVDLSSGFNDVSQFSWYSNYVATARKHGIVKGISKDEFQPNRTVTREEMITMVMKLYDELDGKINTSSLVPEFKDSSEIQTYAYANVMNARKLNIIKGKNGNIYDPSSGTTRGEAVAIIYNLLEKLEKMNQ